MAAAPGPDTRFLSLSGHVGFDSLPEQLVSKSLALGFTFNVLCVGETGIGKSTLMSSLFNTVFEEERCSHFERCLCLRPRTYELEECAVRLRLTIVDTVGFGDQMSPDVRPLVDYVDAQLERYLQEELKVRRCLCAHPDTRLHACLYLLSPSGHCLKALDLVALKLLESKVNVIPLIAKADTITKSELPRFKARVLGELERHGIRCYQFPTDDPAVAELNAGMNRRLPFAVVGSTDFARVGQRLVRAREYPWGTVEVENEEHCDLAPLRDMLIRVNMEDLREQTHSRHYELYRRQRLRDMGFQDSTVPRPAAEVRAQLQRRERQGRQLLAGRARRRELEVKEMERQLSRKFEDLKRTFQEEKLKVEEKRRQLESEKKAFHQRRAAAEAVRAYYQAQAEQDPCEDPEDACLEVLPPGACLEEPPKKHKDKSRERKK
ncbi:septin-8-like [Macrotis lagotis]|uniref:septin-8-like n=1 Tax=Macrotis lagotis TaxID=92651 RepID=UPI003D6881ED